MQHVYQHRFQNGTKVSLTVELSDQNIIFYCEPSDIPPECADEYTLWRNEVVTPDIMSRLTPEQAQALAQYGAAVLNDTQTPEQHEETSKED